MSCLGQPVSNNRFWTGQTQRSVSSEHLVTDTCGYPLVTQLNPTHSHLLWLSSSHSTTFPPTYCGYRLATQLSHPSFLWLSTGHTNSLGSPSCGCSLVTQLHSPPLPVAVSSRCSAPRFLSLRFSHMTHLKILIDHFLSLFLFFQISVVDGTKLV